MRYRVNPEEPLFVQRAVGNEWEDTIYVGVDMSLPREAREVLARHIVTSLNIHQNLEDLVEACRAGLRVAEGEDQTTADLLRDVLAPFEE